MSHISTTKIELANGKVATSVGHVHIDCSASAISNLEMKPIFEDNLITPQTVRSYQPVFSAAFIAHIEASYSQVKKKNELCQVVPLPNHDTDWLRMIKVMMMNQFTWSQEKELRAWLYSNRLDGFSKLVKDIDRSDEAKMAILKRMKDSAMPAMMNLQKVNGGVRGVVQVSRSSSSIKFESGCRKWGRDGCHSDGGPQFILFRNQLREFTILLKSHKHSGTPAHRPHKHIDTQAHKYFVNNATMKQ